MDHVEADVCIVGAGFAGLAAGYRLKQAGSIEGAIRSGERAADEAMSAG
jgi:cation diffusion facilitator CzcD-associated flavoprotein CzcO